MLLYYHFINLTFIFYNIFGKLLIVVDMKKKKSLFKNKIQMVIYIILFCLFIGLFIYFGTFEKKASNKTDSEKFINEYKEVNSDNVFIYLNAQDTLNYIKNDNVIILFGYKNSSFVGYYANILNDVAKKVGIEKIYYYDITEDRKNKNGSYESIVEYLKDYVITFDDGSKNIYAPSFFIKINGIVSLYDDEDAFIKGYSNAGDYFDNYRTNLKKITLQKALEDYLNYEKQSN